MEITRSIDLLYPSFRRKLQFAIKHAQSLGNDIHIFETYRSPARQDGLKLGKGGVTNAKGWQSWHQYGLAVDLAFGGEGKWHWNGDFKAIVELIATEGITWGGANDAGHYQYNLDLTILYAMKVKDDYGVLGVWQKIEELEKERGVIMEGAETWNDLILNEVDAAAKLGVKPSCIRSLRMLGSGMNHGFPFFYVGRNVRYSLNRLLEWAEKQKQPIHTKMHKKKRKPAVEEVAEPEYVNGTPRTEDEAVVRL